MNLRIAGGSQGEADGLLLYAHRAVRRLKGPGSQSVSNSRDRTKQLPLLYDFMRAVQDCDAHFNALCAPPKKWKHFCWPSLGVYV